MVIYISCCFRKNPGVENNMDILWNGRERERERDGGECENKVKRKRHHITHTGGYRCLYGGEKKTTHACRR